MGLILGIGIVLLILWALGLFVFSWGSINLYSAGRCSYFNRYLADSRCI